MQNLFKSFAKSVRMLYNSKATVWRDVRAVECARLESGYTERYRRFKSCSLRQVKLV